MAAPRHWQEEVADALLDGSLPPPALLQIGPCGRGFEIHRHTLYAGLVEVLAAHFPVCRVVVGEEFFEAMARVFAELHPPRSPVLLNYGDALPEFIAAFAPARSTPYLADLASLEAARRRSYHAADVDPLTGDELSSIPTCRWESARARLHPAVEVVRSPGPILSIWEAHGQLACAGVEFKREDVLVTRPAMEVSARLLPPGGAAFLDALNRRTTFAEAHALAAREPGFDLVAVLATAFSSGVLVAVDL